MRKNKTYIQITSVRATARRAQSREKKNLLKHIGFLLILATITSCTQNPKPPLGQHYPFEGRQKARPEMEVIGWSKNENYFAVRFYYKVNDYGGTLHEGRDCRGYRTPGGERFRGRESILIFYRNRVLEEYPIRDLLRCTSNKTAERRLVKAEDAMDRYSIRKGFPGERIPAIRNRITIRNSKLGSFLLTYRLRSKFWEGKASIKEFTDTHLLYLSNGAYKQKVYSFTETGNYLGAMAFGKMTRLDAAYVSPSKKIILIYCRTALKGVYGINKLWSLTALYKDEGGIQAPRDSSELLFRAIDRDDLEGFKSALHNGADINFYNVQDHRPLTYAISNNNYNFAKAIIDLDGSVNSKNELALPPLGYLFKQKRNIPMIKLLLHEGADPDGVYPINGDPILFDAAMRGDLEVVKLLVDGGADVNRPSRTPLVHSLIRNTGKNNFRVLSYMVGEGVNINNADIDGNTPLHTGVIMDSLPVVKLLIENGAHGSIKNKGGFTPLLLAFHRHRPKYKIIETLLQKGANPNVSADAAMGPIQISAFRGDLNGLDLLLKHRANINYIDSTGDTALHRAVEKGNRKIVEYILKNGADIMVRDGGGMLPIERAGNEDMVDLLRKYRKEQ